MAVLIQEFCRLLLTQLRGHDDNVISDTPDRGGRRDPGLPRRRFHYFYDYGQSSVSRALFR